MSKNNDNYSFIGGKSIDTNMNKQRDQYAEVVGGLNYINTEYEFITRRYGIHDLHVDTHRNITMIMVKDLDNKDIKAVVMDYKNIERMSDYIKTLEEKVEMLAGILEVESSKKDNYPNIFGPVDNDSTIKLVSTIKSNETLQRRIDGLLDLIADANKRGE